MAKNSPKQKPTTLADKFASWQLKARKMMAVRVPKRAPRKIVTEPFLVEEEYTGYAFVKDLKRSCEVWCSGLVLALVGVLVMFFTGEYPMTGAHGILATTFGAGRIQPAAVSAALPELLRAVIPKIPQPHTPRRASNGELKMISVDLMLLFAGILSSVALIAACSHILSAAQEDLHRKLAMEAAAQEQDPITRVKLAEDTKNKWDDFDNENAERAKQGRPPKRMRVGVRRIFTERYLTNFLVSVLCAWILLVVLPLQLMAPKPMRGYGALSVMMILVFGTVIAGGWGLRAIDKFCGVVSNTALLALLCSIFCVAS
ncbi:unnamed protein product [Phytomonas sp. EM1]|nr:unnamed protein product [Phytomonas sp. EM1]|eukprot:CCW64508.1 unnamed protein product [Phytomonas sp. isolate EM1]